VISVALRGLAGRKLRAVLTAFAIILGVTMVSGTYVLTDTIDKAFNNIFQDTYANTDAVVSGRTPDINIDGETAAAPSIPASVLEEVQALPDVAAAAGGVADQDHTDILTKAGKAVDTGGAPSFGFGIDYSQPRFNPHQLVEGKWPSTANEVVIDVATAEEQGYKIGDTIKIATLQPVRSFELVGFAQWGQVESLGSATFADFTIPAAQELLDRNGEYDAIQVAAKEGVTPQQLVSQIQPILPADAIARTGEEQAQEDLKDVAFTGIIRWFLLGFAGVALFVGAFVIFNTISITVAQRTREFATIRTIGGSRRQILWSVILEAGVIGFLASLVGLFLGLGLAAGLNWLFKLLNFDLPTQGLVFAPRTIIVSMLIGVIVTLLAGLFPAIRATRVPPIAAVREGFVLPRGRLARFAPYIALAVIGLAIALLSYSLFKDDMGTAQRLISMAVGVLALFVGVAMVSSRTVPPLAVGTSPIGKWATVVFSTIFYPITLSYWLLRSAAFSHDRGSRQRLRHGAFGIAVLLALVVLAGLASMMLAVIAGLVAIMILLTVLVMWARSAWQGFEPEWPVEFPNVRPEPTMSALAKENSRRNPGRTASTAAALMIGIALVTFVAVLASGMKSSSEEAIKQQVTAEYVLTAQDGFTPFVITAGDAVRRSNDVQFATSVRSGLGKADGKDGYVTGIEPGAIAQAYSFEWEQGSNAVLADMGGDGAIIAKGFADEKDLQVGGRFPLLTSDGKDAQLVVKGIYEPPPFFPLLGDVSITQSLYDSLYERPENSFVFVNVSGEPTDATAKSLEAAVADFPDAKVQTRDGWIQQQNQDFDDFLSMLYILLALSVIVSIFGMVNTLVLSVFERTRELGMLRAVGMTRRQVRRMVRYESIITALIGAALGLPLGIFLALLMTRALSQFNVQIAIPATQLVIFAIVAIVVGIVAALFPARRAARLNVLRALQYE
jgi:putative ABC transport system permease protein